MIHDNNNNRDEMKLKEMLCAVDADAPAPDHDQLRSLRQRAADEFLQAATAADPASTASNAASPPRSIPIRPNRRSSMFTLALRGSLVLSAAAALLMAWLTPLGEKSVSGGVPFSVVLEELRGASTLHLQVEKSGQTADILVRAPGLVRWQESPQHYQIAAGSRLWKVDLADNTVVEEDSKWFLGPDRQIDLLALLDVGVKDASPLLVAKPVERTAFDGRACYAYQVDVPAERGRVQINAFADVANNQLIGIVARDVGTPANAGPPLAELRLIARNPAVGDEEFVVAKSLTEDGRIGKVTESQGIVVLRPMLAQRWTPVCRETLLRPGDWLRTELRGANAVKVTLSSDVELTLGPGTLMECISPSQARLHHGQVQVKSEAAAKPGADGAAQKAPLEFTLLAPRQGSRLFQPGQKQLVRVDRDEKIVDVPEAPVWLAGFEGTTNNESLGSLIVNLPDGRNEPLTVGEHKVSVEIRDQIARTTIEETFVNHTPSRLEGVFHFPLPQDASISGFGMWVGNDLVEADVVEKQRAREIFETILREKRDPGLLEWMGGNIFKARVFPIEPHSEKRIKIVYTQVLPLRANRYRYSYGLRSELLRTKPLRELSLKVTVNSALPLKGVTCPTHTVRTLQHKNSAQVEFSTQEYTPTRDFEVVCEVDGRQSDVVVIPHRRGDDGYFLLQLTPPAAEGNWQRELLPDGKPLSVVLLCDTSSSMDAEKRRQQAEFVGTVLTSLGADDRFQLACADVGTAWIANDPLEPTEGNIAKARTFLDERISLGWTDLDRAFADVIQKAPADAHIIYVGDGIVSARSTDTAAFVQRLKQLVGKTKGDAKGGHRTLHSVTVGNSSESVVMKGIASVGHGSTRAITNEQTPQLVALELLNEIAQPGLQDLNVEFRGLKVAAVYPEQLPNVPAGTQQILVGRYLPEGKDQAGEIIVTGMRGQEKVRYVAKVNLKDAEAGNSFIPRLWARAHLDLLLAQGQSSVIRDEIIGLSEQFHIITPYTSLLVLESDADRERFGVTRRYEMRDGERFFAEGRNNANFELAQAQMKRAGDWRQGLRRKVLADLKRLGRDAEGLNTQVQFLYSNGPFLSSISEALSRRSGAFGGRSENSWGFIGGGIGGGGFGYNGYFALDGVSNGREFLLGEVDFNFDSDGIGLPPGDREEKLEIQKEMKSISLSVADKSKRDAEFDEKGDSWEVQEEFESRFDGGSLFGGLAYEPIVGAKRKASFDFGDERQLGRSVNLGRHWGGRGYRYGYEATPDYTSWLNTLFPVLSTASKPAPPVAEPRDWTAQAIRLSKKLLRTDGLQGLDGGIELTRTADYFDSRWNRLSSRHSDIVVYGPAGWVTRPLSQREQSIVNYATRRERGIYSLAFLLGRKRPAAVSDIAPTVLGLVDGSVVALHEQFRDYSARVEAAGENLVKLIVSTTKSSRVEHFWIDTAKQVLVKHESFDDGQLTASVTFDDFVEVAGSHWARKATEFDNSGTRVSETRFEIQALNKDRHSERMNELLAAQPEVQFIQLPFVTLKRARQNAADGSAAFDDRLAMILWNVQLQQWDEVWKHVDAVEKLAGGKPGVRWIRTRLQSLIRRHEECLERLRGEANRLAAETQQDEQFLSEFILGEVQAISSWPEFLKFVHLLKPVYERQPAEAGAMLPWTERLAQCREGMGQSEEALKLWRSLAESAPWNSGWQTQYARRLGETGDYDGALAWLRQQLERPIQRREYEEEALRSTMADLYRTQGRWNDLLTFTTEWVARQPQSQSYNSAYAQHLSTLVFNDRLDQANALVQQWLNDATINGRLKGDQYARLDSALNFAMGNAFNLSFQRVDEHWLEPLGKLALFFVWHSHHPEIASRIMQHHQFQQSDVADRLRGEFWARLQADFAKLTPGQVNTLVGWTLSGRMELQQPINGRKQLDASEVPTAAWARIAEGLKTRWQQAQDKNDKHLLGEALTAIYSNRFREAELLPFLRQRLAEADPEFRRSYVTRLFESLLITGWTESIEQEGFALLRELTIDAPHERLEVQLPALYRLVDAMLANRQAAAERILSDQGGQEKLTRKELAAQKSEIRRTACLQLATRLSEEAKKEDGLLKNWFKMEQAWLDVQISNDLEQVTQLCWQILGDAPPVPDADDVEADDPVLRVVQPDLYAKAVDSKAVLKTFDQLLRDRALATVMNLAMRRQAKPDDIQRILKFMDAGIEQGRVVANRPPVQSPDVTVAAGDTKPPAITDKPDKKQESASEWRGQKFRFLVALDRPDDLERQLHEWIREDVSTAPWRQALARLVAERGKVDEAIQLLEACAKDKLLGAADYKLLSDLYLVVDRRSEHERSRLETYKLMPESQLSQLLYRASNNRQYGGAQTSELDESTLLVMRALFEKSGSPESYFWAVRNIYANSRDSRILQMLPDAMLGRSPQQVYSFLSAVNSQVLSELRNEAAADEILARIKVLRTPERTATDLRALDLLEALVERKSSEILNQSAPHQQACLAALQRAFDRKWGEGEPVLMAILLHQLGGLPAKLAEEQLRELRELQKASPALSRDHLKITNSICSLVGGTYRRLEEAIREMEIEVRSYAQAHDGKWPIQDADILSSYISLQEQAGHHAAGETVLKQFLARPENVAQRKWLDDRLMSLYNHALEHNGAVSLGATRNKLFIPLYELILKQIEQAADEHERYNLVTRLATTFDIAHRNKIPGAADAVTEFMFQILPGVLKRQVSQYRNTITAPITALAELAGPKAALRYVIERMEQYPQRLEISWENSWQILGSELGRRRTSAGATDLDDRALKLVIRELQRELRTGENRGRYIYGRGYPDFWTEKTDAFAKAAEAVLSENQNSGRRMIAVAEYLWSGLELQPRAIEVLLVAHQKGVLDETGQVRLVQWLHDSNRFAESIPLLEGLVTLRPENMEFRTRLMKAYFRSQRPQQLAELTQQTDDFFHAGGRWTEGNIAEFGRGCQGCSQFEHAVRYLTEAVALHQRANPGAGLNNGTLAGYYSALAYANSDLGRTKEAVEAASAAIVCWAPNRSERASSLETLNSVLRQAKDLDDFVKHLDGEAARTGQDSPILRKAIGLIYQQRNEFAKAITQLQLAADLQPNDAAIHHALIACFDANENRAAATKQLLKLIDLHRNDLVLYQQLAERLKDDEAESERAATSIVEASPNEAVSHAALAELRQQQGRWSEAIPEWQQVAELRKLEPNGLLKLAAAQLHEKQWDEARATISQLRQTEWPAHFMDVRQQISQLENQLPKE